MGTTRPPRPPGQQKPQTQPQPQAGYSGTPLHRKLGVRAEHRVLAVAVPAGFPVDLLDADGAARLELVAEPDDARPGTEEPADVVLLFCPDVAALHARLPAGQARTAAHGRCGVAWPKRASGVRTDLTEDVVRAAALVSGWVDVKVCAIDRVWSGLCLMRRARPVRNRG
jgi:hypothetical protein